MRSLLEKLQPLGRALMLPIAVLPVAALLLRLGQADLLDVPFMAAAGAAIFTNLGMLFAIGVGVGLARENHGAAGLAGAVAFLVATEGAKTLMAVPPDIASNIADPRFRELTIAAWKSRELAQLSVPCGILSGLVAGWLYNRYATIRMPDALAFFGGRRFVPIAAGLAGCALAMVFGLGFPVLARAIDVASYSVTDAGSVGLLLFGMLNRLLLVTGLHHVLNNIAWFVLGDFNGATGDLNRFFAGDPAAGGFMSGFFPVMMFGLPAACLAMYHSALPARRKAVGSQLLSLALTSFLTGVTEPIEFTFLFLAPLLFAIHAVLTGISMAIMDLAGVRLGFGFSAGLFDFVLNFNRSTRGWLLIPIGLAYAFIYYGIFRWCIVRFDLKTPGREAEPVAHAGPQSGVERAQGFIEALGGHANIIVVHACTTRLRLTLETVDSIDEPALKALGAVGVVRIGSGQIQVVVGPIADAVADDIRQHLRRSAPDSESAEAMLLALGGHANITSCVMVAGRLRLALLDKTLADPLRAEAMAPGRGVFVTQTVMHVLPQSDSDRLISAILKLDLPGVEAI